MKDIFKKLLHKESKSEPVKKERTYLNNTQILNAVQERMDKTNEKLDALIFDLSIISKYFKDLLEKREEDDKRKKEESKKLTLEDVISTQNEILLTLADLYESSNSDI